MCYVYSITNPALKINTDTAKIFPKQVYNIEKLWYNMRC